MKNGYQTDIEIAQAADICPIEQIAQRAGIPEKYLSPYGKDKAKVSLSLLSEREGRPDGKLILVTAINPTPAGEGKTTTAVGLGDAMNRIGKKTMLALREPSLGPVFGVKGGAAGGGYAQVIPMEAINLHFTGDLHAITAANNLLAAMIDNHIHQGNALDIDARTVTWRRCLDMNDRQLRQIVSGLGGTTGGVPREDGFDITAASEVMAVLCLANGPEDLKARLSRIAIGRSRQGEIVTAGQLGAAGAMAALLNEAIHPNLVQTLEGTPAFLHGGPFANIAHGCNSVVATRMALKLTDYVVTEAGFGADLGAEKFLDIKCRAAGLSPACVVLVATIRALKMHGGVKKEDLSSPDADAVRKGLPNLIKHAENMRRVYHLPVVVAINAFSRDTREEMDVVVEGMRALGIQAVPCSVWADGGAGGEALAHAVARLCEQPGELAHPYALEDALADKIRAVASKVYGAGRVEFAPGVLKQLKTLEAQGYGQLPVCMAKTQYSLSDDAKKLGRPEGFTITIRQVKVSAGAGFVVALTGTIMTMPGLPKVPAACAIDVDRHGRISGLF